MFAPAFVVVSVVSVRVSTALALGRGLAWVLAAGAFVLLALPLVAVLKS